jgi:predicted SnoaL-like aldol condensation-catalyzing enzyme
MPDNAARNQAIIIEVLTSAFTNRDFTALEKWFAPEYIQHNPFIPGSREGLRKYVEDLPAGRHYEFGMAMSQGDIVMSYGRYSGGDTKPLVAMDIFRFDGDKVVEHWDVLQEEIPTENTVAGNPMFTKPQT